MFASATFFTTTALTQITTLQPISILFKFIKLNSQKLASIRFCQPPIFWHRLRLEWISSSANLFLKANRWFATTYTGFI
jgi:hypothetical protein